MRGSLTPSYGLADVVRGIYGGRRSGILTVERTGTRRLVYFERGSIVFVESNDPAWRFGTLLVRRGRLREADLEHVITLLAPGKRIGMVLRDLGYLDDRGLAEAIEYQITESIYPLFSWESGDYKFEEKETPAPSDVAFAISTANVIMEGVRRIDGSDLIRRAMGPTDQVVTLGSNPLLRFQSVFLKPKEGFILSRIDGCLTVDEVAAISPVPEEEVLRCLYGLKCTGILEVRSHGEAPDEDSDIAGFFTDFSGVEQFLGGTSQPRDARVRASPEEEKEKIDILDLADKIGGLDHFGILGVGAGATAADIRKAYYRMAKKYHPDRHHKSHLSELQGKLEAIFVRVNEAYETLKDDRRQGAGDRGRNPGNPAPAPSRGAPAPSPQKDSVNDAAQRQHMAQSAFRDGKAFYEQGDFFGAIRAFQMAVQAQPDRPAYHALLGRALSRNPKWRKEAEEHLLKAIELEPTEAEHYAQLGLVYEAAGLASRADRYFDEALKRDGSNTTAADARGRRQTAPRTKPAPRSH